MKNYRGPGDTISAVAGVGGVKSGDVLAVGSLIGVCAIDAAENAETEVQLVGVFELPKAAEQIDVGEAVYWTGTAVTATAATNTALGAAIAAAETGDATVLVRLSGIAVIEAP